MVFKLNQHHAVSSLPYAKQKYLHIFQRFLPLLADLLMLISLINVAFIKLKLTKV